MDELDRLTPKNRRRIRCLWEGRRGKNRYGCVRNVWQGNPRRNLQRLGNCTSNHRHCHHHGSHLAQSVNEWVLIYSYNLPNRQLHENMIQAYNEWLTDSAMIFNKIGLDSTIGPSASGDHFGLLLLLWTARNSSVKLTKATKHQINNFEKHDSTVNK